MRSRICAGARRSPRFVTAISGLLTVLLLLALRRHIGWIGALSAASLLAFSPGAVYYSRYFIHEIPLVCFTVMAVVAAAKWIDSGRALYLWVSAIAAALMFATKETWIIAAVVLTGATAGAALLSDLHGAQRHRTSKPVDDHAEIQRRMDWYEARTGRQADMGLVVEGMLRELGIGSV